MLKPPVGLIVEWRHNELRIDEINEAIERYNQANYSIPPEWIVEKNTLLKWLHDHLPTSPYLKEYTPPKATVSGKEVFEKCPYCDGDGFTTNKLNEADKNYREWDCDHCNTTGKVLVSATVSNGDAASQSYPRWVKAYNGIPNSTDYLPARIEGCYMLLRFEGFDDGVGGVIWNCYDQEGNRIDTNENKLLIEYLLETPSSIQEQK